MIRRTVRFSLILAVLTALTACSPKDDGGLPGDIPPPKDVAAPPADAKVTSSGIASKILQVGLSSIHPTMRSTATVIYTGWTTDGKMFDSSTRGGRPVTFALTQVIPGWQEGLQLMVVGEKRRFWIPPALAYNNAPDHPTGTLVFDIELIGVR